MKEIELSRGYTAIVDDEDYERVSQYNWSYNKKAGHITRHTSRREAVTLPRFLLRIDDPGTRCGYVNGEVLDNRKSNLRIMKRGQIVAKARKRTGHCSSKYKGVCWVNEKNKWRAYIQYCGKRIHLGYFDSEVLAARHYDAAAEKRYGDLAYLNFPDTPKPPVEQASRPEKAGQRKEKANSLTSRFIGVDAKKGRWRCQFRYSGKRVSSYHNSEAEAAYAYDKLAVEHRGVDAILNFPDHWRRQRQQFDSPSLP